MNVMNISDPKWKLVWSDEFDGKELDKNKWRFDIGNNNGWGNNELQYYTEGKTLR
ncbi:glucan endo-1,3-beta-D-glucosidase [Thermosipho africanus H17ap60334]|nr:glucan endo-1,3-beta-D-glucosidase [Thermosipho africanus H17ap60334]